MDEVRNTRQAHRAFVDAFPVMSGFLYLLHVALARQAGLSLLHILFCLLLLRWLDDHARSLRQAWLLLRWLLLPLLLLHALFTPGALYWSGLPFTQEGVAAGVGLGVHLTAMVLAAMLFSRLLDPTVLLWSVRRHARTRRLLPLYLYLWPRMMTSTRRALRRARQSWKESGGGVRLLPWHVACLVIEIDRLAERHGQRFWREMARRNRAPMSMDASARRSVPVAMLFSLWLAMLAQDIVAWSV